MPALVCFSLCAEQEGWDAVMSFASGSNLLLPLAQVKRLTVTEMDSEHLNGLVWGGQSAGLQVLWPCCSHQP